MRGPQRLQIAGGLGWHHKRKQQVQLVSLLLLSSKDHVLPPVPLSCLHPEDNKLMCQQQLRGMSCEVSAHAWDADKLGRRKLTSDGVAQKA